MVASLVYLSTSFLSWLAWHRTHFIEKEKEGVLVYGVFACADLLVISYHLVIRDDLLFSVVVVRLVILS